MKKIVLWWLLALVAVFVGSCSQAYAQATKAVANSVTCPATGTSAEVLAAHASRESFIVLNTSGATVRVGFLSGSSTATLDDTNSVQLLAGQNFSDAVPSIYIGRIVCMSTTASPATVYVIETRRP